jgi:hypothetical protein
LEPKFYKKRGDAGAQMQNSYRKKGGGRSMNSKRVDVASCLEGETMLGIGGVAQVETGEAGQPGHQPHQPLTAHHLMGSFLSIGPAGIL